MVFGPILDHQQFSTPDSFRHYLLGFINFLPIFFVGPQSNNNPFLRPWRRTCIYLFHISSYILRFLVGTEPEVHKNSNPQFSNKEPWKPDTKGAITCSWCLELQKQRQSTWHHECKYEFLLWFKWPLIPCMSSSCQCRSWVSFSSPEVWIKLCSSGGTWNYKDGGFWLLWSNCSDGRIDS